MRRDSETGRAIATVTSNGVEGGSQTIAIGNLTAWKPVTITFSKISLSVSHVQGEKEILKGVSGEFKCGELTAILGSSGAGKSSLVNILAGFRASGVVLVNGVKRDLNKFRKLSCYIMQQDELWPNLTVQELMDLAADLKTGNQSSPHERKEQVNRILDTIGLKHAKNTKACKLSGGERKRLAIAQELVNNPPVMFLDEPTTGLDSSSCLQLVSLLKTLARGGRNIVCVIHQPSSAIFTMFDQVFFMANGQCIYSGHPRSIVDFMSTSVGLACPSHHNPADFAIEVAVGRYGDVVDTLVEANRRSRSTSIKDVPGDDADNQETSGSEDFASPFLNDRLSGSPTVLRSYGASFFVQMVLTYKRCMQCTTRDMLLTYLRLVLQTTCAVIMGLLYFGIGDEASEVSNNMSLHFVSQLLLMFTACMSTVLIFPLELPILTREYLNNWYSLKAYYIAKFLADLPFEVLHCSIYVATVYFATYQPWEITRFLTYLAASLLNSLTSQSMGLAIGIYFKLETSVFMGPVAMAFCILFSGFFVAMSTAPVWLRWLFYPLYFRYVLEASNVALYGFNRSNLRCSKPYCRLKSPMAIFTEFELNQDNLWIDFFFIVLSFLTIRLLTFFLLRRKVCSKY